MNKNYNQVTLKKVVYKTEKKIKVRKGGRGICFRKEKRTTCKNI